jgi:hypothetical protein
MVIRRAKMKRRASVKRLNRVGSFTSVSFLVGISVLFVSTLAYGADRLVVKDDVGETKFIVTQDGKVGVGTSTPSYQLDVSGGTVARSEMHFSKDGSDTGGWITSVLENNFFLSSGAMYSAADGGWIQKSSDGKSVYAGSGGTGYTLYLQSGGSVGSPVTSVPRFKIDYNGNVGIGTTTPSYPLHMASGAYVTTGGVWTNASSREYKDNIEALATEEALDTLKELNPVKFAYKADRTERHVGFIAEDVPQLVATKDRKGLSALDIVAVLTKVVQELKAENEGLKAKNESLENRLLVIEATIKASK